MNLLVASNFGGSLQCLSLGTAAGKKFTRMEFDSSGKFTGLIAQPLDERDVQ